MLLRIPEEDFRIIAGYCAAPDVLSLISTHPSLSRFSQTRSFWESLQKQHYKLKIVSNQDDMQQQQQGQQESYRDAKQAYLLKAYCDHMPRLSWHFVETNISNREGHMACRIGDFMVIVGGFVEDNLVYIKNIHDNGDWQGIVPGGIGLPPGQFGVLPNWAYGSSLTAIDDTRAIRYGGFRLGGYSGETYQTSILHINQDAHTGEMTARWQICVTKLPSGAIVPDQDDEWSQLAARAYHCATLIFGRYLLIVGGMQGNTSILNPLILDIETWTWYYDNVTTSDDAPSPRHGSSMVFDSFRDRLLLFGGGDGTDLLRSGNDNTEVWELDMNACSPADDIELTFPWVWNRLHEDQMTQDDMDIGGEDQQMNQDDDNSDDDQRVDRERIGESEDDVVHEENPNQLQPSERLNLGRCHNCHHVGRDSVLFLFGSGRPTCNSVLGYDLSRDCFFRPNLQGPLPRGRFTAASVFLEEQGLIFVHGGFSLQGDTGTIGDAVVLDLASGLQRDFTLLPIQEDAEAFPPVDNDQARNRLSVPGGSILETLIGELLGRAPEERPARAATMLEYLRRTQRLGGAPAVLLAMVATGQVVLLPDGSIHRIGAED